MKRRPTMQDVAEAAGVSRSTVSLALRNSPSITRETRDRVQAVATGMGYRPDPLVQRLTTHLGQCRKKESGLVIAWINAWRERSAWRKVVPFVAIYEGAERAALQHGFHMEEFWLKQPGMNSKRISGILHQRGIEHVIIGPLPDGRGHLSLDWEKFSAVAIGYSMMAPQLNRVTNHHLHSIRTGIRQLVRQGCQRIGLCIDIGHDICVDHAWTTGLAQYHLRVAPSERVEVYLSKAWSEAAIVDWVRKQKPDGILTAYYQLPEILADAGYPKSRQPLIALLDWPGGAAHLPGINQRHDETGKAAVELVISQVNCNERGLPTAPKALMVEGVWTMGTAQESSLGRNRSKPA